MGLTYHGELALWPDAANVLPARRVDHGHVALHHHHNQADQQDDPAQSQHQRKGAGSTCEGEVGLFLG